MFELIIKNADGSKYWTERFNSLSDLNDWLEEEKTRKYWKPEYTFEIIDHSPTPPTQAEIDAAIAAEIIKQTQLATLKQRLSDLDAQPDLTAAEVKETIRKLVKFLRTRGLLD